MSDILPIAEARATLTGTLRRFREDPEGAEPVLLGSHRAPEAVILPYAQYVRRSTDAAAEPSVRELLRARRGLIQRLARASNLSDVRVFGSAARGDDTSESDVDLLVTPDADASLFDIAQFELDVESLIGRPVDVVSRRSLEPGRDAVVLAEAEPL